VRADNEEEFRSMNDTNKTYMLQAGTVLDEKWVILEPIGKGGMGEVYRAHQLNLKRDVAIKVVSREWLESLGNDEGEVETGLQRFRREVEAMAQMNHPNILRVYDYGSASVLRGERDLVVEYIAMEYVPGGTLRSTMSKDGFYPEEDLTREWIKDFFLPVLAGVDAIHKAGIVHRDLKPENILMDGKTPRIADFGLSRSSGSQPLTQSVHMMGSPVYMSPEHFLDFRRADERADIYSLGKILFEAIEGKVSPETIPFRKAGLSKTRTLFFQELDRIIQDATEEDKEKRLPTVEQLQCLLVGALDSSLKDQVPAVLQTLPRSSVPPWKKWSLAALAAAVLLVASVTALNLHPLKADRAEHRESAQMFNEFFRSFHGQSPSRAATNMPAPNITDPEGGNLYGYESSRPYYGQQPSPSPIPSRTNTPTPSGQGLGKENLSGSDDCEVAPVQKNR